MSHDDSDAAPLEKKPEEVDEVPLDLDVDAAAERRLLWKMDLHLVPILWLMWTFSNLDRSNIGNAYAGGMKQALHMDSTHYSIALLVFFIGYVILEIPSNMLIVRLRPSLFLPGCMLLWGAVAMSLAACKTTGALAGVRAVLGLAESPFAPGVLYLLSSWYKKKELARRYTLFWLGTPVSGMIGGILAGAIIGRLDGHGGLHGWQWLFIIEGVLTCGVAIAAVFLLPDYPTTTRWLTPAEREIIVRRLADENLSTVDAAGGEMGHMASLKAACTDWRTWIFVIMYALSTGGMTITYFIPTLLGTAGFGYTGTQIQYMTAPIYAVGIVCVFTVCFLSDYLQERGFFVIGAGLFGTVSFAVILAEPHQHVVQYVFLCFGLASIFCAVPTLLVWASNEVSWPREKRAIVQAAMNVFGNIASIYGSFLWPSQDAPRYFAGFGTTMGFLATLAGLAAAARWLFRRYPYPEAPA